MATFTDPDQKSSPTESCLLHSFKDEVDTKAEPIRELSKGNEG